MNGMQGGTQPLRPKDDSLWGWFKNKAKGAAEKVEKAVDAVKDVAGAGIDEVKESLHSGQGVLDSLSDGISGAAGRAFDQYLDPALDQSVLGEDNAFQDQGGAISDVLTNRLGVGESVEFHLEAGATVPTELLGLPNVSGDLGGTISMKRVQKTDAEGLAQTDQNGQPATELQVTLEVEGTVGAAYLAEVGVNAGVNLGQKKAGIEVAAGAEAGVGLGGKASITLSFDPNSKEDMQLLSRMLKTAGVASAESAIPGIGTVLAGVTLGSKADDIAALGDYVTELSGEGQIYAEATAYAEARMGFVCTESSYVDNRTGFKKAAEDSAESEEEGGNGLSFLNLNLAEASAGLGGTGKIGTTKNLRSGETTYTFGIDGSAAISGSALNYGGEIGASIDSAIAFTYDEQGVLSGVSIQQTMDKSKFEGILGTVESVNGRMLDRGLIAGIDESDSVTVDYQMKPEEIDKMKSMNTVEALAYLTKAKLDGKTFQMGDPSVTATHQEDFEFRVQLGLKLGAEIDGRAGIRASHAQEVDLSAALKQN